MPDYKTCAQFVDGPNGRLFTLRVSPRSRPRCRVLMVAPLAEEMNKSRRVMVSCARSLALSGCEVLIFDPSGTGDSAGDFGDVSWAMWTQDLAWVTDWFEREVVADCTVLVAIRAGLLLVPDIFGGGQDPRCLIAWQPVFSGSTYLQQWLRLRIMSSRFTGQNESLKDLRAAFEQGESVEVGGYTITPELANALGDITLVGDEFAGTPVRIFEIKPGGGELTMPTAK